MKQRTGFTLIELLIVIVIIGILAAIAIPKFTKTRERAHFKAMMSDLRNLQAQEELYFSNAGNNYLYANNISDLNPFSPSPGVNVRLSDVTSFGWAAVATHDALDASTQLCALFHGTVAAVPAPAQTVGVVACSGD
jgi:type IV pilus assembly protein PilA